MAWARSSPFTSRREAAAARLGLLSANQSHDAIRRVFRQESARLVAGIVRLVRDVGLAEELAQDALVSALEQWPAAGIPDNPGAWLQAVARNRGINMLRRRALASRKHEQLAPLEAERERQDPPPRAKPH